jgi:hypothetical protein
MTTPSVKAQMPKNVRLAVVGVWVQAALNLAAGCLLLAVVNYATDHGRDEGAGLLRFVAVLSLLIAGALLLCGVFAGRRSILVIVVTASTNRNGRISQGGRICSETVAVESVAVGSEVSSRSRLPTRSRRGWVGRW